MNHPAFVRRVLALVLTAAVAVAAALPGFAVYAMPIQTTYPQESIYLFDADTGEALVEQNPDMVRHVASLTKMMTALLVIENGSDLNASITIPDSLTPEFQSIKANRGHTIGLLAGTAMSAGVNVVMALVLIPLGGVCMRMFSQDLAVIEAGCAYLNRVMPFYFIFSFLSLLNAVMRGAGETVVPMVSTLLSLWLVRLPAAYWLADHFGRDNLFYCYAIGWTVGLLLAGAYYLTGRWKRKSLIAGGASA